MNKQEREALERIKDKLAAQRARMPAQAEYVMGAATQGARGAVDDAIRALEELLNGEEAAHEPAA